MAANDPARVDIAVRPAGAHFFRGDKQLLYLFIIGEKYRSLRKFKRKKKQFRVAYAAEGTGQMLLLSLVESLASLFSKALKNPSVSHMLHHAYNSFSVKSFLCSFVVDSVTLFSHCATVLVARTHFDPEGLSINGSASQDALRPPAAAGDRREER